MTETRRAQHHAPLQWLVAGKAVLNRMALQARFVAELQKNDQSSMAKAAEVTEGICMRSVLVSLMSAALISIHTGFAFAAGDGPDFWDVTGVRGNDALNLHTQSNARSPTIAAIPHDAKGLRAFGCIGTPTFAEWSRMSPEERVRASRARWCQVEYNGKRGWVAGRFLKEGGPPTGGQSRRSFGAWTLRCTATCALEQVGVGTSQRTLLRLERREGTNAQITIERRGIPRQGLLSIYMDGKTITQGPIAPFVMKGGGRIVMPPDDITLGLIKQMGAHKNMVLSFPGAERGVEIHLDHFAEAWAELRTAK